MRSNSIVLAILSGLGLGLLGCGGAQNPPPSKNPQDEVQQLIRLYEEARPKFVVQKEEMIKAEDCGRATRMREAIDKLAADAAMSPEGSETVTKVQMELQQAEKDCLAKDD